MRIFKYLLIALLLSLYSCASGDDEQKVMIVMEVDVNDIHIYTGSAQGAVEYKYEQNVASDKVDSLRSVFVTRFLRSVYNEKLYANHIIDFNGSKITYTYPATGGTRKLVANYRFENDSLFALTSDTSKMFVALGASEKSLYRTRGLCYYPLLAGTSKDTARTENKTFDLESVFELYGKTPEEFKEPTDTVMWLNAKYQFE